MWGYRDVPVSVRTKCKCLIDRLAEASRGPAPIDQLKAKGSMKLTTQTLTSAALTLAQGKKYAL